MFASAVNALAEFGVDVWLELNAHPALAACDAGMPNDTGGTKAPVISSVRREREFESPPLRRQWICIVSAFLSISPR